MKNGIIIDGVCHELVEDNEGCEGCEECSLFKKCEFRFGDERFCIDVFGRNTSHFEVKEGGEDD